MVGEWREVPISEVYEFSSGLSKPRSEFGSGFPFLSFKDIFYNSAVPSNLTELVKSTEQERSRCSIRRGDVFLTRTSETMDELGMSSVALTDIPYATFNGFAKRLRPKQEHIIVPEYARYFFRSKRFRSTVNAMSSMSTRASLNNEMLGCLTILFPSLDKQMEIGRILGALDDKIALNHHINQTLETMAQAIFKSWFVDFDPVKAKIAAIEQGQDPLRAACAPSAARPTLNSTRCPANTTTHSSPPPRCFLMPWKMPHRDVLMPRAQDAHERLRNWGRFRRGGRKNRSIKSLPI